MKHFSIAGLNRQQAFSDGYAVVNETDFSKEISVEVSEVVARLRNNEPGYRRFFMASADGINEELRSGVILKKHRHKRVQARYLYLSPNYDELRWSLTSNAEAVGAGLFTALEPDDYKGSIGVSEVVDIRLGVDGSTHFSPLARSRHCLSIIGRKRSIDVELGSTPARDRFAGILRELVVHRKVPMSVIFASLTFDKRTGSCLGANPHPGADVRAGIDMLPTNEPPKIALTTNPLRDKSLRGMDRRISRHSTTVRAAAESAYRRRRASSVADANLGHFGHHRRSSSASALAPAAPLNRAHGTLNAAQVSAAPLRETHLGHRRRASSASALLVPATPHNNAHSTLNAVQVPVAARSRAVPTAMALAPHQVVPTMDDLNRFAKKTGRRRRASSSTARPTRHRNPPPVPRREVSLHPVCTPSTPLLHSPNEHRRTHSSLLAEELRGFGEPSAPLQYDTIYTEEDSEKDPSSRLFDDDDDDDFLALPFRAFRGHAISRMANVQRIPSGALRNVRRTPHYAERERQRQRELSMRDIEAALGGL